LKKISICSAISGLDTIVDPVRVQHDGTVAGLSSCSNVRIDRTGRIGMRRGTLLKFAGAYHSVFCNNGDTFVGLNFDNDTSIMQIKRDHVHGVRSGLTKGARIWYCQVGRKTFYSNGFQNGFIEDGVSHPWPAANYTGPTTTKQFAEAPRGTMLFWWAGHIFIVVDKALMWSQPMNYGTFRLDANHVQFDSPIQMVKPVAGGVFVSDADVTWFFRGSKPGEFIQELKANYPALYGSQGLDSPDAIDFGFEVPGLCAVWNSAQGHCIGLPDGTMMNVINKKVKYPTGYNNGACLVDGSHIIATGY